MTIQSISSNIMGLGKVLIPKTRAEAGLAAAAVLTGLFYSSKVGAALGACYAGYKGVQQFFPAAKPAGYAPEIPNGPFSSEEMAKIGSIENVAGVVKVMNIKTDEWETAYITFEKGEWGEKFYLFNMKGESLGWAEAIPLPLTDPTYKCSWSDGPPKEYVGYGNDPTLSDKLMIEALHTKDDDIQDSYKYSGYQLFKLIKERYRGRFKDRIVLDAGYGSHAFYYKLGFRAVDPVKNAKIEAAIALAKGKEPKTGKVGLTLMYLPTA